MAPAPFARLADDDERRLAHIAQSHRAAARHGRSVPLPDEWTDLPQNQAKYAGYRNWPEFGPRMPDAVTAFDAVGRRGASAGAERKLTQRAGARHQVDLAVTLQSPSEKVASTASGGGGAGNPPGLAQAKNLLVHFQRLWARGSYRWPKGRSEAQRKRRSRRRTSQRLRCPITKNRS